jgi:hypothetical protein
LRATALQRLRSFNLWHRRTAIGQLLSMATVSFAAPCHRRPRSGVPCSHKVKFDRQNLDGTTTVSNADKVPVDGVCG